MFFFYAFCFGQTKESRLIDSILVVNTGKTYKEYLAHFQKAEKEYEIEKNRIFRNWDQRKDKSNQLIPSVPNIKYNNENFPFVGFINKNSDVRVPLYEISKIQFSFSKIRIVEVIPTNYGKNNEMFFIVTVE
ncbi:hypothetical protein CAPN009_12670 [Capnocytophaga canimorsus]|nr:hypothetical protein CAPN009_12670 [Capnocytophaga canimorsus]